MKGKRHYELWRCGRGYNFHHINMWICWKTGLLLLFCGECCFSENHITPNRTSVDRLQGSSIVFQIQVTQFGTIGIEGGKTLATIFEGRLRIHKPEFEGRIRWDHQTGLFSLHNLTIGDSRNYVIESTESPTGKHYYQLTVYEEVSSPQVSLHDISSCIWMCSVKNSRSATLSWYKDNVLLNQTRNPDINTGLSLLLTSDNTSTHVCVAANPVINHTYQLMTDEIQERCLASLSPDPYQRTIDIIIGTVMCAVCIAVIGGVVLFLRKRRNHYMQAQSTNEEPQNDVQYSEILHTDNRPNQGKRRNIPELAAEKEGPSLTSIYAKIQPHSPEEASGTGNDDGRGGVVLRHL